MGAKGVGKLSVLEFNAETHTYRMAGRVLPSVTQVVGAILPGWRASEFFLQRGRALHHACALHDRGILDESTVAEEIAPRLRAWRKFLADSGAEIPNPKKDYIEIPRGHGLYGYAGTADRLLCHNGHWVVCDLKSTNSPQVIVQLGGYALLLGAGETGIKCTRGVSVELRDNGDYRAMWLKKEDLRQGEQAFLAALTVFNFMDKHHLRGNGNGN